MSGGNNWGVINSKTDNICNAGLYKDEAEKIARRYTTLYKCPYGIVKYKNNFEFEIKNVYWFYNTLFDIYNIEMKKHPYEKFYLHKDLIAITCGDRNLVLGTDTDDEIVCILDKEECVKLAKELYGIYEFEFENWIKNEYTWNDSEAIIDHAIDHNKVLHIWRV